MKQWITLLAVTAVFTACSKQDLLEENDVQQTKAAQSSALRSTQSGAYVSDWEQSGDWVKSDNGGMSKFVLTRKTPEVTTGVIDGGLVLSYAKLSNSDPAYAAFNNPKMMPFYFLPEAERPNAYANYFSDASNEGNITITYSVPFTKQDWPTMGGGASLQNMKTQYVVMTKDFLKAHGLDAQTVRNNYSYEQVMSLVSE